MSIKSFETVNDLNQAETNRLKLIFDKTRYGKIEPLSNLSKTTQEDVERMKKHISCEVEKFNKSKKRENEK